MRRHRLLPFLILALVAGLAACARGVAMNPEPGQDYAIEVVNPMPHAMVVYFDDGTGQRLLGTVGANRTDRFIVAGTGATTISVIAHDEAETHTVRRTVVLVPGETVQVRLAN